jgi:intein/homing endonuclease
MFITSQELQNKTFSVKYPQINEKFERHFLRGYFDGDGCIRINTDK